MKTALFALMALLTSKVSYAQLEGMNGSQFTVISTSAISEVSISSPLRGTSYSTSSAIQRRGTAGIEQLRDDFAPLYEGVEAGLITRIEDIEQPAMRELFEEISASPKHMKEINSQIKQGSMIQKIMVTVGLTLFGE
jgi:hypothetical protein